MRFLIYIIVILLSITFFVYKQEISLVPKTPSNANVSTSTPTEKTSASLKENTTSIASTSKPVVKTKPQPQIDQAALDLIQQKINETNKAIKEITLSTGSPQASPTLPPRLSQQILYDKASSRVVNFFCEYGNGVETASGVIISPTGYILSNAHVAEAFVNKNYECRIRQGSPARNIGYAKIVMFPKAYTAAVKGGWDEHVNDVSVWKITRSADGSPLPQEFPYYPIDPTYTPQKNQILATFSYPGELLGYEVLLKNLNMLFGETIVSEFNQDFTVSGMSLSSQSGSSGGILVDVYTNNFAGLIFAVSIDKSSTDSIDKRKLFSLSPYAVKRVIENETGLNLADFLNN